MQIEIDALDTIFCRDARPFTMGDETGAGGMFPPSPSVMYGLLRSIYFANYPQDIPKAGTKQDPTQTAKISRIAYKAQGNIFFPVPLDVVKRKELAKQEGDKQQDQSLYSLKPQKPASHELGSGCLPYLLRYTKSGSVVETIDGELFPKGAFSDYLKNKDEALAYQKMEDLKMREAKIGIARSRTTHSSQPHALYRLEMHRLQSHLTNGGERFNFVISFDGLDISDNSDGGLCHFGAEGKAARYTFSQQNIEVKPPLFSDTDRFFKVYLAAPALFMKGWLPSWIDQETLAGTYKQLGQDAVMVSLIAAAVGKYQLIGGFDMRKRMPKPLRRAVPAGSVYYFKLEQGDMATVLKYFHQQSISDAYPEQGFGLSYVGKYELTD